MDGNNITGNPKFEALNFTSGDGAAKIFEVNTSAGGPIRRDRLWFYGSYRYQTVDQVVGDTQYPTGPVDPDQLVEARNLEWRARDQRSICQEREPATHRVSFRSVTS